MINIFLEKMANPFANSGDPDQTPRSAASDLGLHCLPSTLVRVSQLQWVSGVVLISSGLDCEFTVYWYLSVINANSTSLSTLPGRCFL